MSRQRCAFGVMNGMIPLALSHERILQTGRFFLLRDTATPGDLR